MQLYVVGGAVRDALLGLPPSDRDWVAVGATPEQLIALGHKPVGKDFPVFLHPTTGEEVALARTERKTGPGYRGFAVHAAPGVTLEEDLRRRDLTINAIAQAEDGTLIDPFGGAADLRAQVLRHVSPAFAEDPVRLLRLARFAARFPTFAVAPETEALLAQMVAAGEVDTLVPERVWQELARALMAERPSRFVDVLTRCGALQRVLPGLCAVDTAVLDTAAARGLPLEARWACLAHNAADGPALADRLRAPTACRELAAAWQRERAGLAGVHTPEALLALLDRNDAWRRPDRFAALAALVALHDAVLARRLGAAVQSSRAVDVAAVARDAAAGGAAGAAIGEAIRAARLQAIAGASTAPETRQPPAA
jgi:tRNA nucleotidyltransferase (CCA-adding enzyme)